MAAPPTSPALRARYDARRAEVVACAARLFARKGFHATSVPDLVEATGLKAGGLYHYIGSKDALLVAICSELMAPLLVEAEAVAARDAARADELLRDVVRIWTAHVEDHRDHMLVFQQERHVIDHGEQWRAARARRKAFERLVEQVLARARDAVPGAPPTDPRLALSALLGMVNHTAQWYRPRGRLDPVTIADGYVALVLG